MLQEIILKTILTIIGVIVTSSVGYLAHKMKDYRTKLLNKKENENKQNIAIRSILQKQLTDVFFAYEPKQQIPDYVYKNWLNLLKTYEDFDGDDYIHAIADKMKNWQLIKTDILDKGE